MAIPVRVDPALLAEQAVTETVGTTAMGSAAAAAAPVLSAVLPAGSDSVSLRCAAALQVRGAETTAVLAEFTAMRGLFAGTVAMNNLTYTTVEAINQTTVGL